MSDFDFFNPVARELEMVELGLTDNIDSEIELLSEASVHLIKAGGKRLRPAFALLAAKFYRDDLKEIIPMAVALELVHMATLVHDDVIDNSEKRRGTDTVKSRWGNRVSVYAGNYIFARSLALVARYGRSDIIKILSQASMKICEGEIVQMLSCFNTDLGLKNYLRRIERKTALLISVSCQMGAMLCFAPQREIDALLRYGYYLGMAFQITDDILDFIADEETLGKPIGSDIRQGIITLPALYAFENDRNGRELKKLLSTPESCINQADRIIEIVVNSGGIEYAYNVTQTFAQKAQRQLDFLPEVPVKKTFFDIVDFIQERDF